MSRVIVILLPLYIIALCHFAPTAVAATIYVTSDDGVYCLSGDTIHIDDTIKGNDPPSYAYLSVDQHVQLVVQNSSQPSFEWVATGSGTRLLRIYYVMPTGDKILSRRIRVHLLDHVPQLLKPLPQVVSNDAQAQFTTDDTAGISSSEIQVYLGSDYIGQIGSNKSTITIPFSSKTPGQYQVFWTATDDEGDKYYAPGQTVTVPDRVTMVCPQSATYSGNGERVSVTASVVDGITAASVAIAVDGTVQQTLSSQPYTFSIDISSLQSGSHAVSVIATDKSNRTFRSDQTILQITNNVDDKAKQAKIALDAQTAANEAEQNRQVDEMALRSRLCTAAIDAKTTAPTGRIGRVKGLSVMEMQVNGDTVAEWGAPLTVEATARTGSGNVRFLANATADADITAQRAAEYCKTKLDQMGDRAYSSKDVVISYAENEVQNSGPSAGVADAVVYVSALLGMPIDDSVAVTGAIGLQGEVDEVGGLNYKIDEAFSDPNTKTIIVPGDQETKNTVYQLIIAAPERFVGRKVIFATTMDQVFRHTIIGWDDATLSQEQAIMRSAITAFGMNKDDKALDLLNKANNLAPEDSSISMWIVLATAGKNGTLLDLDKN